MIRGKRQPKSRDVIDVLTDPFILPGPECSLVFAACDRIVGAKEPGHVPCLHVIGLRP
jgi:hypothetical protein